MVEITLGGKVRSLRFSFKSLRSLEVYYKKPVSKILNEDIANESLENLVVMFYACLKSTEKSITVDKVETLIDDAIENGEISINDLATKLQEALSESTILKSAKTENEGEEKN